MREQLFRTVISPKWWKVLLFCSKSELSIYTYKCGYPSVWVKTFSFIGNERRSLCSSSVYTSRFARKRCSCPRHKASFPSRMYLENKWRKSMLIVLLSVLHGQLAVMKPPALIHHSAFHLDLYSHYVGLQKLQ